MKRLIVPAMIILSVSCSNPEDRATGNPDSKRFNSDEKKVTNSRPGPTDPESRSDVERPDTSEIPSTSSKNVNSATKGTNRSYGTTGDTARH